MNGDIEATKKGLVIKIGWKAMLLWLVAHWAWIVTWAILAGHMFMTWRSQQAQNAEILQLQRTVVCMADRECRK